MGSGKKPQREIVGLQSDRADPRVFPFHNTFPGKQSQISLGARYSQL